MENVIKYINNTLGQQAKIYRVDMAKLKGIPLFIASAYTFWRGELFNTKIYLLEKINQVHSTPGQYKKQQEIVEKSLKAKIIFVLPEIKTHNRIRLIQQRINFIIEGKQLFIPDLLIDLKDYNIQPKTKGYLQPAAQVIILYHLLKQPIYKLNYRQIAKLIDYPYLTISRAVENLNKFGLCQIEGTREKKVYFDFDRKNLWLKALAHMNTPVKKKYFINEILPRELTVRTNRNALAHYTDLNDDSNKHVAISHTDFLKLRKKNEIKEVSEYDGDFSLETWRYDPLLMAEENFADPLSLFLEFKNIQDERIEMALDQILEKYIW